MQIPILVQFRREQQSASAQQDPMAPLMALATVSAAGLPEVRTLVLREVEAQLAVFINGTSPKWQALQDQPQLSFMTYWPSSQLQYRFVCTTEPIPDSLVHASWLLRPDTPKRVDHLYELSLPQSQALTDRQALLTLTEQLPESVLQQPSSQALGLYLIPQSIERLDLNMDGMPHDRRRYERSQQWREQV